MTKTKSLKKALICSVMSLVMCLSMLVGTTFAWFTDSVTNNVNQIVSGNLDVELWHTTDYTTDATAYEVVESDTTLYDELVWVHGADSHQVTDWQPNVMSTEGFKIENKGSLPLQYSFSLNFDNATKTPAGKTLADVLVIKVEDENGEVNSFAGDTVLKNFAFSGVLNAGETYEFKTNISWTQSANDNDYNVAGGLSIDIGVCVVASQLNDKVAVVSSQAEAQVALDNATTGTTIYLVSGVNYGSLKIQPNIGHENTISGVDYNVYSTEYVRTVENLTIVGATGATIDNIEIVTGNHTSWYFADIKNLVIDSVEFSSNTPFYPSRSYSSPVFVSLGSTRVDGLTVKNCKIDGNNGKQNVIYFNDVQSTGSTFETYAKNVTITGNTVSNVERLCELRETENVTITNNTITNTAQHTILLSNNAGKTYSGNVTITGNTSNYSSNRFVRMAGAGDANVVIKDNNVVDYMGEDEDYIKVTDSTGTLTIENNPMNRYYVVSDTSDLTNAFSSDAPTTVNLTEGTYTLPTSSLSEGDTIICDEGVVISNGSSLNINGATVIGANFKSVATHNTVNGTYKDCTFTGSNGLRFGYAGDTVVFENCVFDGSVYGAHFDSGANEVTFKNCTFSGFNAMGAEITKLTLEGCTFKALGNSGYNGINLWGDTDMINCTFVFDGSTQYEWVDLCNDNKTVTFTGCVVTDGTTETALKDVVGNYGDGNTIIIDGVTQNIPNMS
ncbi:MAG: right-handed parallel beta-helix repeat-containing protein [Clostridia bacterium]|nr:right-handed parallel beta-helix repeat-containing protein [Clostridia bacterium]